MLDENSTSQYSQKNYLDEEAYVDRFFEFVWINK